MKNVITIVGLMSLSITAFAGDLGSNILARSSNFYKGDDDAYATCLILEDGNVVTYIAGLVPSSMKISKASQQKMDALETELKELPATNNTQTETVIPADSSGEVSMIASKVLASDKTYPGYVKVDASSSLGQAIASICKID